MGHILMATSFSGGTESAPGLYVSGDTDTGIFSTDSDTINIGVGGEARVKFQDGRTTFYSGASPSSTDFGFLLSNEIPNASLGSSALSSILFYGKSVEGDSQFFAQVEGRAEDPNNATLEGRLRITLRDGPTTGDQVEVLDAFVNRAEAGVPFRYISSIDAGDLTNSKDFASVEKVAAQIAAGVGAPFPIHVPLLGTVDNGTYPLVSKAKKPFTINGITLKSGAGTATVEIQKNGAAVTGLTALSVSSSASDHTPTGDSTEDFPIGAALSIVISSTSSLSNLTVDIDAELTD